MLANFARLSLPSSLAIAAAAGVGHAQCQLDTLLSPGNVGGGLGREIAADGDLVAMSAVDGTDLVVHIYARTGPGQWDLQQTIVNPAPPGLGFFGSELALDGDTLAVAALTQLSTTPAGTTPISDSIFLFERQGGTFVPTQVLDLGLATADFAAELVGLELDGDTLAVAAFDHTVTFDYGFVDVFERTAGTWSPAATLAPPAGFAATGFGYDLVLEGSQLFATQWGSFAHGYERTPGGWQAVQTITVPTCGPLASLYSLELEAGQLFLGVDLFNEDCPAEVRVFEQPVGGGNFAQASTISLPDLPEDMRWGQMIADGSRLGLASTSSKAGVGLVHGGVYLYQQGPTGWSAAGAAIPEWPVNNVDGRADDFAFAGDDLLIAAAGDNVIGVGSGSVAVWSISSAGCPSLLGVPPVRSVGYTQAAPLYQTAGRQDLVLDAGAAHAGQPYLVLGSVSGTAPGIAVDGFTIPLVFDAWTIQTLTAPNTAPLVDSFGVLDADGRALAAIQLPGALDSALAGITLQHAFVALDLSAAPAVGFASQAAPLALVN